MITVCKQCSGSGSVVAEISSGLHGGGISYDLCPRCSGRGYGIRTEAAADSVDGRRWRHLAHLACRAAVYCPEDLAKAIKDTVGGAS